MKIKTDIDYRVVEKNDGKFYIQYCQIHPEYRWIDSKVKGPFMTSDEAIKAYESLQYIEDHIRRVICGYKY